MSATICQQCLRPFVGDPAEPGGHFCSAHCLFQSMGQRCGRCAICDTKRTGVILNTFEASKELDREITRRRESQSFYGVHPSPWLAIHRNWPRLESIGDRVTDSVALAASQQRFL